MKVTLGIVLVGIISAASALADVCMTESRGLKFVSQTQDINAASDQAYQTCVKNRFTDNYDCRRNLRCDEWIANPYPNGISCATSSKGFSFHSSDPTDINGTSDAVYLTCKNNRFTDNDECLRKLHCADLSALPIPSLVICRTESNGLKFHKKGTNINSVTDLVYNECINNRYTDNMHCSSFLKCEEVYGSNP